MGFFHDLGRRAEKLKSEATDAADAQAEYECADCGKAVFTDREACPRCGSEAVEPRTSDGETDGSDSDGTDATRDTGPGT